MQSKNNGSGTGPKLQSYNRIQDLYKGHRHSKVCPRIHIQLFFCSSCDAIQELQNCSYIGFVCIITISCKIPKSQEHQKITIIYWTKCDRYRNRKNGLYMPVTDRQVFHNFFPSYICHRDSTFGPIQDTFLGQYPIFYLKTEKWLAGSAFSRVGN